MPRLGIGVDIAARHGGINWSSYWKTRSALWLEADAVTGLADGDAVSTWLDQSPNGNNGTQGTAGNRPVYKTNIINGKPVIRFTKANAHWMTLGNSASLDIGNNVTIICLYDTTIPTTRQTIYGAEKGVGALQLELSVSSNSCPNTIIEGAAISSTAAGAKKTLGFDLMTYQRNGAGANHIWRLGGSRYYFGQNSATSYSGTGHTRAIGRRGSTDTQYFDGDLVALIQFNETLADADILQIEKILAAKYAVSLDIEATQADASIAVIPDSQEWTFDDANYPYIQKTCEFVRDKYVGAKIGVVFHVGDFVSSSAADQWARWEAAFLNHPAAVPFLAGIGNHDYNGGFCTRTNTSVYDGHFPTTFYTSKSWWSGGFYETGKTQNLYFNITLGGQDYMFIMLEFGPRQGAIDWANALIQANPTKKVIISTHAYVYNDGTRIGTGDEYNPHTLVTPDTDVHDGDELWTELVSLAANDNVIQIWSGHETGFLYTKSTGVGANVILEILCAHQSHVYKYGCVGLMQFYGSLSRVKMIAYSLYLGWGFFRETIAV
jgi:hypothetical protein